MLQRRRHSTPISVVEEAIPVSQEASNDQNESQARISRPSPSKSLLSRGRSLRMVKSLSDLRKASRKDIKSKDPPVSLHAETLNQTGDGLHYAVVGMTSVNSASSAPLYSFEGAE